MDFVEVVPENDVADLTSLFAARQILNFIGVLAHSGLFSWRRSVPPAWPYMTIRTREKEDISVVGSPSTTIRSACFPYRIEPQCPVRKLETGQRCPTAYRLYKK